MSSAFHLLCPGYNGTLIPTAPTAIRLWDTFIFYMTQKHINRHIGLNCKGCIGFIMICASMTLPVGGLWRTMLKLKRQKFHLEINTFRLSMSPSLSKCTENILLHLSLTLKCWSAKPINHLGRPISPSVFFNKLQNRV